MAYPMYIYRGGHQHFDMKIYRTSIEHQSKIYRKSIEHLSKIYRTSIEHLSEIYGSRVDLGWIWGGSGVDLRCIWVYLGGSRCIWLQITKNNFLRFLHFYPLILAFQALSYIPNDRKLNLLSNGIKNF